MYRKLHRRLSPSTFRKRRTVVALALGFTAVPAVALAATGAVPGDPFKLGQENKIADATTTLTGTSAAPTINGVLQLRRESGAGPVLKVENTSQGIVAGDGISIRVPPGKSPINVNSNAGKSNLDVNKLDGRSSEDFLPSRLYTNTTGVINGPGGEKTSCSS